MTRQRPRQLAALLVLACLACESAPPRASPESASTPAGDTSDGEPTAQDAVHERPLDEAGAKQRRREIEAEIRQLGSRHPWAGEYSSFHVDAGRSVVLAPQHGYAESFSKGLLGKKLIACGSVREDGERLVFTPEFATSESARESWEVFPVRWGERRYLIYESRMLIFCNGVNSGSEQSKPGSGGLAFNRRGSVVGLPQVPAAYREFLLAEPIAAKIVGISDRERAKSDGTFEVVRTVVLDVGRDRGAFVGMELYGTQPEHPWILRVSSVHDATCEAEASNPRIIQVLVVGAGFSTRCPRY